MRTVFIIVIVITLLGLGFRKEILGIYKPSEGSKSSEGLDPSRGFAVLELFTSEGCSSCPPADNLLPQLAKLDSNIIPLSFHVDYWNHLGWTDTFSKAEFSERQREYSRQFNFESIYTPQLIVNGEYELVGSIRVEAESAIKKALTERVLVQLHIADVKKNDNKIHFTVTAEGDLKKMELFAALVQKQAVINVKAGENDGIKLSHTNVVRSFSRQAAAAKTEIELELPSDLADNNWEVIVYTRLKENLKITGVAVYH